MSKSELKRLCALDPVGMAEKMHMLEHQLEAEKAARVRAEEFVNQHRATIDELAGKSIEDYVVDQAYITALTTDNGLQIGLRGLACQMLAAAFAGQFKGSGAINYLEVNMTHDELGPFTVTIQRTEGKTPAQKFAEAEAERDKLQAALDGMEPIAWIRQHPDGALTYEILHDEEMEPVRKISGAWKPLYRKPEVK